MWFHALLPVSDEADIIGECPRRAAAARYWPIGYLNHFARVQTCAIRQRWETVRRRFVWRALATAYRSSSSTRRALRSRICKCERHHLSSAPGRRSTG